MNYSKLETSLIDVIKEEQAKLGYRKEKISLYYPLVSLNHFFKSQADAAGMMEILREFPSYDLHSMIVVTLHYQKKLSLNMRV